MHDKLTVKTFIDRTKLRIDYFNGEQIKKQFKETRIRMGESCAVKSTISEIELRIEKWYQKVNVSLIKPHKTERALIVGSDNQLIWRSHNLEYALTLIGSMIENNITTWKGLPHNIKIMCSCSGESGFDYPVFPDRSL